jgi:hypothetical protein
MREKLRFASAAETDRSMARHLDAIVVIITTIQAARFGMQMG